MQVGFTIFYQYLLVYFYKKLVLISEFNSLMVCHALNQFSLLISCSKKRKLAHAQMLLGIQISELLIQEKNKTQEYAVNYEWLSGHGSS